MILSGVFEAHEFVAVVYFIFSFMGREFAEVSFGFWVWVISLLSPLYYFIEIVILVFSYVMKEFIKPGSQPVIPRLSPHPSFNVIGRRKVQTQAAWSATQQVLTLKPRPTHMKE